MLAIPSTLQAQFEEYLRNKAIPNSHSSNKTRERRFLESGILPAGGCERKGSIHHAKSGV